jgi:hypothetical protein
MGQASASRGPLVGVPAGDSQGGMPTPCAALEAARVNLIERIRDGVPERQFVPGGEPWLLVGKRYVFVAPAGAGKSLIALIVAVDVVAAGGTVAIVDVDMGEEEYTRRLADLLNVRDDNGTLADACAERFHYFAYPRLSGGWGAEDWAAAFVGMDGVIFDSSRLMLSAHEFAEDSNDDYATFAAERLVPLSRAGKFTIMLDNTGHGEKDRSRGAKAKDDLNEVVYAVKVGAKFDREKAAHLILVRKRTRFPEVPSELRVPVGGDAYGPVGVTSTDESNPGDDDRRSIALMERLSKAIELKPGMSVRETRAEVTGNNEAKALALETLIDEGYVRVEWDGQVKGHFSERPYRAKEDPKVSGRV